MMIVLETRWYVATEHSRIQAFWDVNLCHWDFFPKISEKCSALIFKSWGGSKPFPCGPFNSSDEGTVFLININEIAIRDTTLLHGRLGLL
jgi:hypothetical protein